MDIHNNFMSNLSTYLPNELVNICNDYLLKYVCYECYKPLLKYNCDDEEWIRCYNGKIFDYDDFSDYLVVCGDEKEYDQYFCDNCTNVYIECYRCLEFCRFIGFCGLYYKDGNEIYITNNEKHKNDMEYDIINPFFDESSGYYIEERNMKYVKIDNDGLHCYLTGPDGGCTHFWKCENYSELFILVDK